MISEKPLRILHVLGSLNRGGAETWLVHALRHMDRERFQLDFLVHTTERGAYDDEVRALGARIIPCLHPRRPRQYARNFLAILREHGPYDVVHSHVHHYSGYVLRLAHRAGVPARIAHSHSDTSFLQARAGLLRGAYLALMRRWVDRHATLGLAASRKAAAAFFGSGWHSDPRWRVLYCGIDLTPFQQKIDSTAARAELGIPPGALVVGHVGRFDRAKNQAFLVDILAALAQRDPRAMLLLVGDGNLRSAVEEKVRGAGLSDRVVFAGTRSDVPRLMVGAMDVFVLPSRFEGLPLVLVEAQAAGLPCVVADVVTEEATLVEPLLRTASVLQPPTVWAEEILAIRHVASVISASHAQSIVRQTPLNVVTSTGNLQDAYHDKTSCTARDTH